MTKKYSRKLKDSFEDDNNVAQEMLLMWIGLMLTGIFIFIVLGYLAQ